MVGGKGEPDHFPLLLDIPLKVVWLEGKMSIKIESEEEDDFLLEVRLLGLIPIPDIMSVDQTQRTAQAVVEGFEMAWSHHAKANGACTRSKSRWDNDSAQTRSDAMMTDSLKHWVAFKAATCKAKCMHFDECINEISHTNLRPWDLMDWVGPCKTSPVEAISSQGVPCTSPELLWNALHSTFNSAVDRPIDLEKLGNAWTSLTIGSWVPYFAAEMSDALAGTLNQSAPGPDHISWRHLKQIVQDNQCGMLLLWLANTCILSGH